MKRFTERIESIANEELEKKITAHLDDLTKPRGSLGRLEEFARRYCLSKGDEKAVLDRIRFFTFAGDHGILPRSPARWWPI